MKDLNIPVLNCKGGVEGDRANEILAKYIKAMRSKMKNKDTVEPKLVFATPEKLNKNKKILKNIQDLHRLGKLQRVVIDEAHCLSQWGHEFRVDYLKMNLKKRFPGVQIMAMTATATKQVRENVISKLGLENCLFFKSSFHRPNLRYLVKERKSKKGKEQLADYIKDNYKDKSGIVYCLNTKRCDEITFFLRSKGISCQAYHSKLEDPQKTRALERWKRDEIMVIVATIAFGMGIDKPDVRYVIHYNFPKSIENYNQESGRAGRDGRLADCIILYSKSDRFTHNYLAKMSKEERKKTHKYLKHDEMQREVDVRIWFNLQLMTRFCEDRVTCRRRFHLLYFGEDLKGRCCGSYCDNCYSEPKFKTIDLFQEFKTIMEFFAKVSDAETGHIQGAGMTEPDFVDILRGKLKDKNNSKNRKRPKKIYKGIEIYKSNGIFGLFKNQTKEVTEKFVKGMIQGSYLTAAEEEYYFKKNDDEEDKWHSGTKFVLALNRTYHTFIKNKIFGNSEKKFCLKVKVRRGNRNEMKGLEEAMDAYDLVNKEQGGFEKVNESLFVDELDEESQKEIKRELIESSQRSLNKFSSQKNFKT